MTKHWNDKWRDAVGDVADLKNYINLRPGEVKKLREMHRLRETDGGHASSLRTERGSEAPPRYRAYTLSNFRELPQVQSLSREQQFAIEVVAQVLPFKTNNYVVDELIDWDDVPNDPMFVLNFPQREMLVPHHFDEIAALLRRGAPKAEVEAAANRIRLELNPHPAGQLDHNVPTLGGTKLTGMQHKYRETVLFFPSNGQTCHAFCTFCFRWPQFVGMNDHKFGMREAELLVQYLRVHPEVSDVLFTGGDPMIMRAEHLAEYVRPLLAPRFGHIRDIRIGTKALAFWPHRFLSDPDADELLGLFEEVVAAGRHLAIMAHFSHPRELQTAAVRKAIRRIRDTGTVIRTQAPLVRHVNDSPAVWADMWRAQVALGCVPYYMFVERDTGPRGYFEVPLAEAHEIFAAAYRQVSGLARTVRGPSMSADPGKVAILGTQEILDERVFVLSFLQGRKAEWVGRPFFARFDPEATWLDQLRPVTGNRFFFEKSARPDWDTAVRAPGPAEEIRPGGQAHRHDA
jgi:L-lysine 2,3-aminomutase